MSLDISLYLDDVVSVGSGIFIREDGQTKEISRVEWDERFPGCEPSVIDSIDYSVYDGNITHNLAKMAREADLYMYLWHSDKSNITKAYQLIMPLRVGLRTLESDPERFRKFNPRNGWGTYETLVELAKNYLAACERFPDADIFISR